MAVIIGIITIITMVMVMVLVMLVEFLGFLLLAPAAAAAAVTLLRAVALIATELWFTISSPNCGQVRGLRFQAAGSEVNHASQTIPGS